MIKVIHDMYEHSSFMITTAVKPLEYEDEYRALEQNLNLTM